VAQILLGQKVKDLVTGLTGIAITRAEFISGAPRVGVQPGLGKDGNPLETHEFDESQLKVLDVKRVVKTEPNPALVDIGQEGKDRITGFKGIITGRAVFLNGCARIALQPPVDKEGKARKIEWFDETNIESKRKKVVAAKEEPKKRTGGPGIGMPTTNTAF
jgi:hypothetical protein